MSRCVVTPTLDQVLEFCARDPVERVFLEDVARRGFARFRALEEGDRLLALCYFGANVVPSGEGCGAFAGATAQPSTRMIIGDEQAVTELWGPAEARMSAPREDRPGQPVYVLDRPPDGEDTGLRRARPTTSTCCCPPARRRIVRSSAWIRSSVTPAGSGDGR